MIEINKSAGRRICEIKKCMELYDLEIYKLAREISKEAWMVYQMFDWRVKKTMGDQFISAVDSVGANIAEGFGRYHYLDKNKFNYNARGSLIEVIHWLDLLVERGQVTDGQGLVLREKIKSLGIKLNNYITATRIRKLSL